MNADMFPEAKVDPTLDNDRRYTTRDTMDLCKRLAGVDGWDLDVAADEESHWAPRYYDVQRNGLAHPWTPLHPPSTMRDGSLPRLGRGQRWNVWCNPPYSDIKPWVRKAWQTASEISERFDWSIAMLLPCNRTEQPWWHEHVEPYRDDRRWAQLPVPAHPGGFLEQVRFTTHFLPTRVKFGHPGNRDAVGVGSPPFGCVLLVWRRA